MTKKLQIILRAMHCNCFFLFFVYLSEKSQTFDQFCRKRRPKLPPSTLLVLRALKYAGKFEVVHAVFSSCWLQTFKYIPNTYTLLLNSPRLEPPSLEKTFYATYAYYDGDQRTTYVCTYLFREMQGIHRDESNKNGHFVCFLENE